MLYATYKRRGLNDTFWLINKGSLLHWKAQTRDDELNTSMAIVSENKETNGKYSTANNEAGLVMETTKVKETW